MAGCIDVGADFFVSLPDVQIIPEGIFKIFFVNVKPSTFSLRA